MPNIAHDIALSATLNTSRLGFALTQLGPERSALLQQLPWFLHSNQPGQPGFVFNAPFGFVEPPITVGDVAHLNAQSGPLLGFYTMGSSGSVGQGPESDFDCWLIYPPQLDNASLEALELKCRLLSDFYLHNGIELHIFLLTPDWMERGQRGKLSKEHSGSAQSWLLLEEFYRSQIHLAGKPLAWWPHAPQDHPQLLSLGELRHLPSAEIFGGVLWHLFKGLDRPHKALLKILLLESYVADIPDLRILRDELWIRLKAGRPLPELDHYRMMFERIEEFLIKLRDHQRLSLARRCFYLKCGLPLSQPLSQQDWRYSYLRDGVERWQFTRQMLQHLDNAHHWHSGQLHWFNERLNHSMLTSYQRLTHLAKTLRLPSRLRLDELTVLTRKLSAQYEAAPNKIPKLNRLWSYELGETSLTLVAVQSKNNLEPGWYLYRRPPEGNNLFGESPLYQSSNRLNCVLWAASNGLIGPECEINCYQESQCWHSDRLSRIGQQLGQWYRRTEQSSFSALGEPWQYQRAFVVANLDLDPTKLHPQASQWHLQRNNNPLALGTPARSMLGDLHLITTNTWGERHCFQFRGEEAPLQLLNQLFSGLGRKLDIEFLCCAKHQTANIERTLTELVRSAEIQRQLPTETPWFIDIAEHRYAVVVSRRQLRWRRFDAVPQLLRELQMPAPEPDIHLPEVVRNNARRGITQIFIDDSAELVQVFMLDVDNRLQSLQIEQARLDETIERFSPQLGMPLQANELGVSSPGFERPQFYRLQRDQSNQWQLAPLDR
ncbi:class I adenylate cyclase [Ferrimonas lipolytica]|uniref:Class I adenylate cyclase n=1 Tax=Ferrimonas lipolytica TaxID=2724191 RepID=A0A6H1UG76_9GAMM|nr:class I adenylate cyclase [Ferrimonas lipolytica]QIZ78105.1 class I adenylate cyclase [Ferrimonas lipolytica]